MTDTKRGDGRRMKNPRINVYQCKWGCHTVTVDVDKGVTPFMIPCKFKGRTDRPVDPRYIGRDGYCIGTAQSSFYPKGPKPPHIKEPEWEWYKPTEKWAKKKDKIYSGTYDHWKRGGLSLRERTNAEPIYHEDTRVEND